MKNLAFFFFFPDLINLTHNYLKQLFLQYIWYNYVNAAMFMVLAGAVSKDKQSYWRHRVSIQKTDFVLGNRKEWDGRRKTLRKTNLTPRRAEKSEVGG